MKTIVSIVILFIMLNVSADVGEEGTVDTNKKECDYKNSSECFILELSRLSLQVEQNPKKAIALFKKSCDIGKKMECFILGLIHLEDYPKMDIIERDNLKAKQYLIKSCNNKLGEACTYVSRLYKKAKNKKESILFAQKACDLGERSGCKLLKRIHARGAKKDINEIIKDQKAACAKGSFDKCDYLGVLYTNGKLVKKDYIIAVKYFKKACDAEYSGGCHNLGVMYQDAQGVKKDYIQAVKFYKKACDLGSPQGCHNLGGMYKKGHGVDQDYKKAKKYFQKSCKGGDSYGCNSYNNL